METARYSIANISLLLLDINGIDRLASVRLPWTGSFLGLAATATRSLTVEYRGDRLVQNVVEERMAKLALIYGMRLLPEEDLGEVKDATVVLKNGRTARVTMHLIEGTKEEIEATFRQSIEAFFEMYPEI
jgi:hypothetical protein